MKQAKNETKDMEEWMNPPQSDAEPESEDLQPQPIKMDFKEIEEDEAMKVEDEQ